MTNNNLFGIMALIISVIIGTVYITSEVRSNSDLKDQINQMQKDKDSIADLVKNIQKQVSEKDIAILNSIKTSYEQIGILSKRNNQIDSVVGIQEDALDSIINVVLIENKQYEKK